MDTGTMDNNKNMFLDKLMHQFATIVTIGASALLLTGCMDITNTPGTVGANDDGYGYVAVDEDPLEPINRSFFRTHRLLDQVIIRPVSKVYSGIVPDEGRDIVSNILDNLAAPVSFVNSILQGDAENTFATFWRFTINSTLGLAGAFDFAENAVGLKAREADFGQTLAYYGVNSGAYLFLPVFGPTTVRDGVGRGVDTLFRPVTWAEDDAWRVAEGVAGGIDFRARNMKAIDDLYNNSIDPYAAFRSAYLQRRAAEIREWTDGWSW